MSEDDRFEDIDNAWQAGFKAGLETGRATADPSSRPRCPRGHTDGFPAGTAGKGRGDIWQCPCGIRWIPENQ
jgi:ribosome modulation factor